MTVNMTLRFNDNRIQSIHKYKQLIFAAFVFTFLLVLNFLTADHIADDYLFSTSFDTWAPKTSLSDIWPSVLFARENFNGRVFSHFFAQLFLLFPKPVFNFVNAAIGTLLVLLIGRTAAGSVRNCPLSIYFLIVTLLFCLTPAFGQTWLWLTGSCNYLWTACFTLLEIQPYLYYFRNNFTIKKRPKCIIFIYGVIFLLFCFIAGAYSENGSLAMLFVIFIILLQIWINSRRLPRLLTAGFLSSCSGFLFMMLSPSELSRQAGGTSSLIRLFTVLKSNSLVVIIFTAVIVLVLFLFLRTHNIKILNAFFGLSFLSVTVILLPDFSDSGTVIQAVADIFSETWLCVWLLFAICAVTVTLAVKHKMKRQNVCIAVLFVAAAFISIAIFLLASYFPARSACCATMYLTASTAIAINKLLHIDRTSLGKRVVIVISAFFFLLASVIAIPDIKRSYDQALERDNYIRQQVSAGNLSITVPCISVSSKFSPHWPGDYIYYDEDISNYYRLNRFEITEYVIE